MEKPKPESGVKKIKKAGANIDYTLGVVREAGYDFLVNDYIQMVLHGEYGMLKRIIGLEKNQPVLTMFHGTAPEKIPNIKRKGLCAFKEWSDEPQISVTPSPLVALAHVITNGPHDSLREQGRMKAKFSQDKPVLLVLKVPKEYLRNNPDSYREVFDSESAQRLKKSKEENTQIHHFYWKLEQQIATWKYKNDTSLIGLGFPIKNIPVEFIFVRTAEGDVPVREYDLS